MIDDFYLLQSIANTVDVNSDFPRFRCFSFRYTQLIKVRVIDKIIKPFTSTLITFKPALQEEFVVPFFELEFLVVFLKFILYVLLKLSALLTIIITYPDRFHVDTNDQVVILSKFR